MAKSTDKHLQEQLAKVPLFADLSPKHLKALAAAGKVVRWKEGEHGVVQGSKGAAMFLILSGGVEVTRDGRTLARLYADDYFGETAMFTGNPRNAEVAAIADSELFALSRISFARVVKAEPAVGLQMLSTMAERNAATR